MKKIYLSVVCLLISIPLIAQFYVEPEKEVECSVFLAKEGRGRAQQGLEMWDDYIFSCEDGGHVNIYDFKSADPKPVAGFELASSHPDNHVNNVCFGVETKRGASFPLLYITNGKVGSELEWLCFVESITRRGKRFSSEIAQTIELDGSKWVEKGYVPIFGAPSWLVDRERGFIWIFSARKRTVAKVTKHAWENQYVATKFRIPSLSEGAKVRLDENDILDQVVFPYEVWFTQAGCMHDGKIYFCFGVGKQDDNRPSCIRVYDTDSEASSYSGNVITLFKDAKAELGVSNVNAEDMINQNIQEKTYTVSIQFNNPTLDKPVVVAPYNPFIKVFNSATEVHLTDHKPTTGANNRFPSGADISRGDVDGTYFICKDGFPFAIHVDARLDASILNLDLKKENQRIDKTYPKFAEWAKTRDPQIKWWK